MSPTQIKLAVYGGVALLLWLLRPRGPATDPGRVTKTLDVVANVDSPYFGMTDAEIAEARGNPAVDPKMRELIATSNLLIAQEE